MMDCVSDGRIGFGGAGVVQDVLKRGSLQGRVNRYIDRAEIIDGEHRPQRQGRCRQHQNNVDAAREFAKAMRQEWKNHHDEGVIHIHLEGKDIVYSINKFQRHKGKAGLP